MDTEVFLATDKSPDGGVFAYEPAHTFANGSVKPAVCLRCAGGAAGWLSVTVAARIYVVKAVK